MALCISFFVGVLLSISKEKGWGWYKNTTLKHALKTRSKLMEKFIKLPWRKDKFYNSPYLEDPNRLADVIAAIQAMATYKFYKLTHEDWANRLAADKSQAKKWKNVFEHHPEFFRLDNTREKASLVWRRQFPKRYNVDSGKIISSEELANLSEYELLRISRIPLSSTDIKALIDTAVNMHSRALEYQKDKRWWVALLGVFGGAIGAIIGGLINSK